MSERIDRAGGKPPHLDRLSLLWRRVAERKIVQWGVAYVALAYGIQHGVVLTGEAFEWPHAVQQISMLLLGLGLPVVMVCAWYHGEKASRRISGPELTIIAILLAIGSLFFYVLVKPSEEAAARSTPTVQQASLAAARDAATSPRGAISLAVLPFVNLSSDKEQEFFSDGMTEEITAALAKVPDLRVVGRTSAFQFKGQNQDLRAIGQSLGATHLIEGSVRKVGGRLRITAQLIKADDGSHIWAESYDRDLTDIFATQEDIARAITTSLRMPLGLKPGENLVNNRNIDPDSYDQFLRAKGLFLSRQVGGNPTEATLAAIPLLEGVIARNPSYAPAWAWLSACYSLLAQTRAQSATEAFDESRAAITELRVKGEGAARKAMELDPEEPGASTMLGLFTWSLGKFADADAFFQRSLSLNPDSQQMTVYADRLADAGRVKEALAVAERAHAQDPLDPSTLGITVLARWLNGDDAGAIALARTSPRLIGAPLLTAIYASQGHFPEAADALAEIAGDGNSAAAYAVQALRKNPVRNPVKNLPPGPAYLRLLYPALGVWERLAVSYERQLDAGYIGGRQLSPLWHPAYGGARKTERFKALMKKVGLVDYWRAKGWPPQCHPVGTDDFACE